MNMLIAEVSYECM